MTPKAFWESTKGKTDERKRVAKGAGTTVSNLRCIALYDGCCSAPLARRLEISSGGAMSMMEILFRGEIEDRNQPASENQAHKSRGGDQNPA